MQPPQLADIFLIPLISGDFAVGQVAHVKQVPAGMAFCLFTPLTSAPDWPPSPILPSDIISLQLIKTASIVNGTWQTVGFEAVPPLDHAVDMEKATSTGFKDFEARDPAIIEAFVNAYHGHYPWDGFPERDFFTKMLIRPDQIPLSAKKKSQFPQ